MRAQRDESSAAALTGLQFVVIVLGAELSVPGAAHTTSAFGRPTVVHCCAVLLKSAILSARWGGTSSAALAIAAFGLVGIGCGHQIGSGQPQPETTPNGADSSTTTGKPWRTTAPKR